MTAKNIKKASDRLDRYYTPKWVVRQCLDIVVPEICPDPKAILEPGAGGGAFVDGCFERFPFAKIHAFDIDPDAGPWEHADVSHKALDFTTNKGVLTVARKAPADGFDLVIGNPPFTFAQAFIERGLRLGSTLVFLLRQGFLSSEKRFPFFQALPPSHVFTLCNRPKFVAGSHGDTADYCFLCYDSEERDAGDPAQWFRLPPVSLEERRAG
jgi:hypothetical protein